MALVMGGVGGLDLCGFSMQCLARAGRLPCALEVITWGHGFGLWYADLTDALNRDRQAARVADAIRAFRAEHPGEPVFLVAKSAGAGIAIGALERLGADEVERVILLAPAMSPGYDMTAALRAVRREIVAFCSPLDVVILGAGTWLFGTMDGVRTFSAGLVGFDVPDPGEPDGPRKDQYAKLRQVRWQPHMAGLGHLGGHFGTDQPCFLRACVVPLLRVDDPGADAEASGHADGTTWAGR